METQKNRDKTSRGRIDVMEDIEHTAAFLHFDDAR